MRPIAAAGLATLACILVAPPASGAPPIPGVAEAEEDEEEEADPQSAQLVDRARHYYGIARSVTGCSTASSGEDIVVCGSRKPDPRYEPPPPPPPPEAKTVALGAPPVGRGVGVGVTVRGCFLQKCPKELYFIDLKAIPEPPPGSDADKIARGEMRAR